jgi:four helix bundle protein
MSERIGVVRDLVVYKKAFDAAMEIFELSKTFPKEELYSLTDQIRRSSRSVCANLSEAWRKRRYRAVFVNKLTDAGQEAAEAQTWLEFALTCGYLDQQIYEKLFNKYEEIFAILHSMTNKSDTFCKVG